jgi:hypothetical protein
MTTLRYWFAGLLFESDLPIPEWSAFGTDDGRDDPDARIVLDREGAADVENEALSSVSPGAYRFSVAGVARFLIADGNRIVVAPANGADHGEVRAFLLGSALATLCIQRDVHLLHASVVRTDRTIALCGPRGAGKSTVAAALIHRGATFICDDLGRFDIVDGRAAVHPSAPRLKLHQEALEALAWPVEALGRVHLRSTKLHVPQVPADGRTPVALDDVFLLEWGDGPVGVTSLKGVASLHAMVAAATYHPPLLESMGRIGEHWGRFAALAANVRVHRVVRPRRWSALDAVAAAIEATA